jgi:hypothetical protein
MGVLVDGTFKEHAKPIWKDGNTKNACIVIRIDKEEEEEEEEEEVVGPYVGLQFR